MPKTGSFRSLFWPVHRHEYKKFLPTLLIFFLITFNYTFLRSAKDALVVTAPNAGAETIPFLKVWAILPMAFLITFLYTRLSNRFSRERVFYMMLGLFLGFFLIFTFVLYPLRESLHPHEFADRLSAVLPAGFKGLISIIRNWTFTLFYVMSDLWSSAIMTVLFWGFANAIFNVSEAKRFYAILALGANISSIVAGLTTQWLSNLPFFPSLPYGQTAWDQTIAFMNLTVVGVGGLTALAFRLLNKHVLNNTRSIHYKKEKEDSIKHSMRASFRYLANSRYLLCIAVLVVAYNLTLNLVEVVWKDQVKALYPDPRAYSNYMGQVNMTVGYLSVIIALFIAFGAVRKFGWTLSAMLTPILLLLSGIGFFFFLMTNSSPDFASMAIVLGNTPLALSVFFGGMQNALSRGCKYTLFDTTKELAFVPLDNESKLRGKTAIDGVGSRLGKSGASLTLQALIFLYGTIAPCIPHVAVIFLVISIVWIIACVSLGKQFNLLTREPTEATTTPALEGISKS